MIAGDHRHAVGIVGDRTPWDELVHVPHQLADPGRRALGRRLGAAPGGMNLRVVTGATAPGPLAAERRRGLRRQHERQRLAGLE